MNEPSDERDAAPRVIQCHGSELPEILERQRAAGMRCVVLEVEGVASYKATFCEAGEPTTEESRP